MPEVLEMSKYYDDDGYPKKCPKCRCKKIDSKVHDTINGTVCEEEFICSSCGVTVAYWAYGYFGPNYQDVDWRK